MKTATDILAVIPARGGSKSIPGKNVKLLGGHPLIAWSIAAARASRRVTRVIVTTDDEGIAGAARAYGAEVPFRRPDELAGDLVTDLPVFEHAVQWMEREEGYRPDLVVQLRPTSPFRPPGAIDEAVALLEGRPEADSVRAVTPSGQNPFKMWRIEDGVMRPLMQTRWKEPYNMPRQELPDTYWQTGHIEVIRTECITGKHSLTGDVILPLVIDPVYAVDLDTPDQWAYAEYLMERSSFNFVRPKPNA